MPIPSVTSAPMSAAKDRKRRMVEYSIMMGIRMVCILAVFLVPGWWRLIPCAGAILLPYLAVVTANVSQYAGDQLTSVTPKSLPKEQTHS